MKMKKISIISIVILILGLLIAGCGTQDNNASGDKQGTSEPQTKTEPQAKTEPLKITMAGYSAGGASSAMGEAVGESIRKDNPGTIFNYEPGTGGANEIKVNNGDTEIGLSSSIMVRSAQEGTAPFKEPLKNITALSFIHTNDMIIVADKRSGITSEEDLKTKPVKIATSPKNSFMELGTREYLKFIGTSYEDIEKRGGKVYFVSSGDKSELMRNRKIDLLLEPEPNPFSGWIELSNTVDLQLIPVGKEAIEQAQKDLGYPPITLPKGTYPFQDKDYDSFSADNIIIANKDLPDETAYAIVKAMYNHMKDLQEVGYMKNLTAEKMPQVGNGVTLHPGAVKFYKEVGLLK